MAGLHSGSVWLQDQTLGASNPFRELQWSNGSFRDQSSWRPPSFGRTDPSGGVSIRVLKNHAVTVSLRL